MAKRPEMESSQSTQNTQSAMRSWGLGSIRSKCEAERRTLLARLAVGITVSQGYATALSGTTHNYQRSLGDAPCHASTRSFTCCLPLTVTARVFRSAVLNWTFPLRIYQIGLHLALSPSFSSSVREQDENGNLVAGTVSSASPFAKDLKLAPLWPIKRIIICCDGTWQSSAHGAQTIPSNVGKMKRSIDLYLARNNPFAFHNTEIHEQIENAFHALGLDEHRKSFSPSLWTLPENSKTNLIQCWLPGVYVNISGGSDDGKRDLEKGIGSKDGPKKARADGKKWADLTE
ncbi:hypothetical protein LEMA_P059430.1 [Plenodomus lingam JN3]|uniref:T6SS Phospholipase effector Tle1-like catalytic domain-containing protein n=1 Tax=Leptosphaeria maculans (strain JN3 / isolate v23.1.3 / race Av1-4-5-6-7-8) TaxID=985895 RepID=E4ZHS6_LEPMJ|nr:hypothetical protein LEMA_P059430.1 [Plenodomus lingam JN3]CBX90909.1 hypothetical protein LEMA_P059430.1 [Plenodomus lingam JN3]